MSNNNLNIVDAQITGLQPGQVIEVPVEQLKMHLPEDDGQLLSEMAALSANVYNTNQKDFINTNYWSTDPIEIESQAPNWKFKIPGLKYEVWKKTRDNDKPLIAIVFRGSYIGWDWYTNVRWLTRFIPFTFDHYDQTRSIVSSVENEIDKRYGLTNVEIVTTGHSLGGGLAQFTAYASRHIKTIFSFDSSPVTGFYDIKKSERDINKMNTTIYRIYENKEALSFFRNFMKYLYPVSQKDPQIIEIKFNFSNGNLIEKHSIDLIAKKLNDIHHTSGSAQT